MATGLQVYDALKAATIGLPCGSEFAIDELDGEDLCKLTRDDLTSRGFAESATETVRRGLMSDSLVQLGQAMGLRLKTEQRLSLVPKLRMQEAVDMFPKDGQTQEEMLRQLDMIRHPERYTDDVSA